MSVKTPMTVADGDLIGPEIMQACLHVLKFIKIENLRLLDGQVVYSLGQG
jgi:hypothetical protein